MACTQSSIVPLGPNTHRVWAAPFDPCVISHIYLFHGIDHMGSVLGHWTLRTHPVKPTCTSTAVAALLGTVRGTNTAHAFNCNCQRTCVLTERTYCMYIENIILYLHIRMYTYVHTYIHIYRSYICTYIHTYVHTEHTYICTYIHAYRIYIFVCPCHVPMYVHMYIVSL